VLTTLRIKNLALVEDLTVELQPGYNVITGETGAGKSILIGALDLVLGERADRTVIRSGSETCSVEAVFESSSLTASLKPFLQENGLEPCEDSQLVLKRSFSNSGTNRQFINGSPTTLNILASLGEWLVDIHGPHEHQSLLNTSRQLEILDAFGSLETDRNAFAKLVKRRAAMQAEKSALIIDEKTYAQQLDLLRFQANEIEAAKLQSNEEQEVEREYRRASNAAKLLQLSHTAIDMLSENESSLLSQAGIVGRTLQELQRVDASAASLLSLHEETVAGFRELQAELSRYTGKLEVEPARLAQLEERLNLIQSLKRKYGATVPEILAFGEQARRKLGSLEQRETELARLHAEIQKIDSDILKTGQELTAKRRKIIPRLSKTVSGQLSELGFKQSRFDVLLSSAASEEFPHHDLRIASHGFDSIEFQFAPNPGEPPRPLRGIASSGELARVMLALKTVVADQDQIPVLVFDEVDANVGGETANVVGEKMQEIAKKRQVLCITHLPQVAAPASAHFVATKETKAGRTISEIKLLDKKARVVELTRMLGGQTEAARKHAEALLH
jgi:DNA repair protein RecN (Recombination protein N)